MPARQLSWSLRSAGIGKGHKYDFTKMVTNTPGPGNYNIKSLEESIKNKKKFTMGVGRDHVYLNGLHPEYYKKDAVPGPGQYPQQDQRSRTGIKFGKSVPPLPGKDNQPGPGEYPLPPSISNNGKYSISKFKGSGAPRIPALSSDGSQANRFVYNQGRQG